MSNLQTHMDRTARAELIARIQTATEVRTRYGWYDILHPLPDGVAVAGDFGDFRIPYETILEVR